MQDWITTWGFFLLSIDVEQEDQDEQDGSFKWKCFKGVFDGR